MANTTILFLSLLHIIFWVLIVRVCFGRVDVFDPFYLIAALYFLIFIYAPYVWINEGKTSYVGVGEVMKYLPQGMLAFNIGFLFFSVGYISYRNESHLNTDVDNNSEGLLEFVLSNNTREYILRFAWTLLAVSLFSSLMYYYITGRNIVFMLTMGQGTERIGKRDGYGLYFMAQFIRSAIPAIALILYFSRRITIVHIIALYITLAICVSSGSRNLALCAFAVVVVQYYLKYERRPSLLAVLLGLVLTYLFVGFIGIFRSSFKFGGSIDFSIVSRESMHSAFMFNVEIFFPFYVLAYKLQNGIINYHYGLGIINIAVQLIPRIIWPSKPTGFGIYGVNAAVGDNNGGAAYPNIGEFYYETGFLGMIVLMYLYGRKMHKLYNQYCLRRNPIAQVRYALIYSYILQFVCRGHFPSWGLDFLFMFIPIVYLEKRVIDRYYDSIN